jgi:hypothetical protein
MQRVGREVIPTLLVAIPTLLEGTLTLLAVRLGLPGVTLLAATLLVATLLAGLVARLMQLEAWGLVAVVVLGWVV